MASSFGSINTALTSLYAQRRGLDVTGQNIANANTEGYTRQRVEMQAQVGSMSAAMYARTDGLGAGVAVSDVQRMRDEFLETRGRTEHASSSYLAGQVQAYRAVEDVFAEPGDTALQAQLHDMWDSWSDVANEPSNTAARAALIQQSTTVADGLRDAKDALASQWSGNQTRLSQSATELNDAAKAVAQLNDAIVHAKASGVTVNELEDRRDLQVMKLAELAGATASRRPNGAMDVYVGNSTLVSEFTTRDVEVVGAKRLADQAATPVTLRWADTKTPATPGGMMGAVADALGTLIPGVAAKLDGVAAKLISTVNTAHAAGYGLDGSTGTAFFSGTDASTIAVAVSAPQQVAASATAGTFNGSVADALAGTGSTATGPDRAYQEMIAELGVSAQTSARRSEIQSTVTEQVDAARESESGVNLDEEMTHLLTYQRGYEAASRVLTTIDSMLDQLINRTGLVGR